MTIPRIARMAVFISGIMAGSATGQAQSDGLDACARGADAAQRIRACTAVIDGTATEADKARAYRIRATARLSAGASEDAIADFGHSISLNPADAAAHAGRGEARLTRGDHTGAIADLTEAIRLAPRAPFYYNARGHAYLVTGNAESAAEDFTKAIDLDPKSASALNNRGLARSKLGNLDSAIADYTAAIMLNPLYALAYNNRGYAHETKGAKQEAGADFNHALSIDPALNGARAGLARLGVDSSQTTDSDQLAAAGGKLAEKNFAWCHATGRTGRSPNAKAPPFREIALRHPVLALREPLSRAIAAPHEEMPNFRLPDNDVDKIIAYIDSLSRAGR